MRGRWQCLFGKNHLRKILLCDKFKQRKACILRKELVIRTKIMGFIVCFTENKTTEKYIQTDLHLKWLLWIILDLGCNKTCYVLLSYILLSLHLNVWTLQKDSRELDMQLKALQTGKLCSFPPDFREALPLCSESKEPSSFCCTVPSSTHWSL